MMRPFSNGNRHSFHFNDYSRGPSSGSSCPPALFSRDNHINNVTNNRVSSCSLPVKHTDKWACDYCQVATYATYQEACNHERYCKMNPSKLSGDARRHGAELSNDAKSSSSNLFDNATATKTKMLLCMPTDKQSLSDRQCYVRSHFVEIFEATEADVSSRHSRGAQKLRVGQIGIRCMHCSDLDGKQRAERGICFPSSISRIYQTVADMQRFHFEACTEIPDTMKSIYRSLKTTRPRGQGSPQSYWADSAKDLGLVDTDEGIRLSNEGKIRCLRKLHPFSSSTTTTNTTSLQHSGSYIKSPFTSEQVQEMTTLPPLSPESSQSSRTTMSSALHSHMPDEEDANILLALRSGNVSSTKVSPQWQ